MNFEHFTKYREFRTGRMGDVHLRHGANCHMDVDELLTIYHPDGNKYDIVCKAWGFYATPSFAPSLIKEGLIVFSIRNQLGRTYIVLVRTEAISAFNSYCLSEELEATKLFPQS